MEVESKIAFLEILLRGDGRAIMTTAYRKLNDNDVYSNCHSFCPGGLKQGTLKSLVQRA